MGYWGLGLLGFRTVGLLGLGVEARAGFGGKVGVQLAASGPASGSQLRHSRRDLEIQKPTGVRAIPCILKCATLRF